MFFAILMTCYVEAGVRDCQRADLPDPYRTLSECLIDIEKVNYNLAKYGGSLFSGECTQEEPL